MQAKSGRCAAEGDTHAWNSGSLFERSMSVALVQQRLQQGESAKHGVEAGEKQVQDGNVWEKGGDVEGHQLV